MINLIRKSAGTAFTALVMMGNRRNAVLDPRKASALFVLALLSSGAGAEGWQLKTAIDAMTDRETKEAYVENANGDRFVVMRRGDGSIWGYVSLGGTKMFGTGRSGVTLRIDKHPPVSYSGLAGRGTWEWNPTLVGFRMRTPASQHCEIFRQLYDGASLTIRYHPSASTQRDIQFALSPGDADPLVQASQVDLDLCGRIEAWKDAVMAKALGLWKQPNSIAPGTVLSIMARVDDRGRLLNLSWVSRSGTRSVDRSYVNAFNNAAPYDPPPEGFDASNGVLFRYVEGGEQ